VKRIEAQQFTRTSSLTGIRSSASTTPRRTSLEGWDLDQLDFLFIENVGNLVCPASYDVGENLRVVLLSVTEGEDKPLKYPIIFNTADAAVLTKMDLAAAVEFDPVAAEVNIQRVRPGLPLLKVSSKNGEGISEWLQFLVASRSLESRERQTVGA
jgi:hydrogenase nickel incorporation protein HypB